MNILSIIETNIIGGPGKGILQLLEQFQKTDIHLFICGFTGRKTHQSNEFKQAVLQQGSSFFELREGFRFDLRTILQARRLIEELGIDIIQTHGYKGNVIALALRRLTGTPWVSFAHGWTNEDFKIRVFNALDRWLIRCPDRIVAVSEAMKNRLISYGVKESLIKVIYNAVDIRPLPFNAGTSVRSRYGIPERAPLIGVIGRLSPEKGQMIFLQAFVNLVQNNPDINVLMIGNGPDRSDLENFVKKMGLEKSVIFTGHQKDISSFYDAINLVVIPSRSEGLPNVVLESLSYGKPLIATAVGGIPEVIQNGINGLLVPSENISALSNAINYFFQSPEESKVWMTNGQALMESRFSIQTRIRSIERLYNEIFEAESGRRTRA